MIFVPFSQVSVRWIDLNNVVFYVGGDRACRLRYHPGCDDHGDDHACLAHHDDCGGVSAFYAAAQNRWTPPDQQPSEVAFASQDRSSSLRKLPAPVS